ncbi:hypothetical protein C8R45DRAFT_783386, partial [Mycena sanguinolenta]
WSLMEPAREARTLWRNALDPVHERLGRATTSKAAAQDVRTALEALQRLPWNGTVKQFRAGDFVEHLSLWFTTDWLKTDHEDQMLELLASDLELSDGSTACIEPTYVAIALNQAYSNPPNYRTAARFGWLRRLGSSFATKTRNRLATIVNLYDNHWIVLAIDFETKTISYGDGFHAHAPPSLRKSLDWWLFEHLGDEFKWINIPVVAQNDPYSCGILAYFALAHWFDSKRFPLPKPTAASMAEERIKMFLRIIEQH